MFDLNSVNSLRDAPTQYVRMVSDLREGREVIDTDPNVLVTYIPLHQSCKRVRAFRNAVLGNTEEMAQKFYRADFSLAGEGNVATLEPRFLPFALEATGRMSGQCKMINPPPLTTGLKSLSKEDEERHGLCVLTEDGRFINFNSGEGAEEYYSLIIQKTGLQYVHDHGSHRDGNDQRTDNMYATGPGIGFLIDNKWYALEGPCITQHRGTDHPIVAEFGIEAAAEHIPMPLAPGQEKVNFLRTVRSERTLG
ncbi:MAG: hypothetical protein AB8B83_08175 [Bdellovibrionales bacterium]